MKLMEWFKGKKTYATAIAGGVVFTLMQLGYLDKETAEWFLGFLGIGAVASMRAAIGSSKNV